MRRRRVAGRPGGATRVDRHGRPPRRPRQSRPEVGRGHAEEDDARRQDRAAHRSGDRLDVSRKRYRRVRQARGEDHAAARRRIPRVRRIGARAERAARRRTTAPSSSASRSRRRRCSIACRRCRRCRCSTPRTSRRASGSASRGATLFPRQMAFGAAGDEQLAFEAAHLTAVEARAIGVHVNFSPIADVNNNPRNPVINIRSLRRGAGCGRAAGGRVRARPARRRDARDAQALSRARRHRRRLAPRAADHQPAARRASITVELPPFRAGIAAGADAVMTAHIELPALDNGDFSPASLSQPIVTRPAARRDEVRRARLHRLDGHGRRLAQALAGRRGGARHRRPATTSSCTRPMMPRRSRASRRRSTAARFPPAQIDASVRRILRAKARLGLHRNAVRLARRVAQAGRRTRARGRRRAG